MKSIWNEVSEELKNKSVLKKDIKADVLVIGGGLAGILCAYELKERGVDCVLVERNRIGSGNTGNTTAKITAQHGVVYAELLEKFGAEKARQYYDINQAALKRYCRMSKDIPCDLEIKTAYVYSRNDRGKLEREAAAYDKLHISHKWRKDSKLPFSTVGILGIEEQAQFHPLKLVEGLLPSIRYFEKTAVLEIENGKAITDQAVITADKIVIATHYPMVNVPGGYFIKMIQKRSYVLGLKNVPPLDGMYIDEAEGGCSFRSYKDMLLFGGGGHKTGKSGGGWKALRRLKEHWYINAKEEYAWAAQDCMTLDHVPYIGLHRKSMPNLYVATGFNKWGMTGAMSSAMVLGDMIVEGKSDYEELFSPQRTMAAKQTVVNVAAAGAGLLSAGKRCTHLGCGLKWCKAEQNYVCPCHGSRFDKKGAVLDGPAKRRLNIEK